MLSFSCEMIEGSSSLTQGNRTLQSGELLAENEALGKIRVFCISELKDPGGRR